VKVAACRLSYFISHTTVFGRPLVATPGVPPDRVKMLRDAYHRSLKDPALLEDLKKRHWSVDAISGEELAKLAKEVVSQPPNVVERMMKLLGG
jgi:tripartite-type tricarboxylate transporter receptor subunit TctC